MAAGRKTGGRVAGTPNRATKQVKDFLERVFTRALSEKVKVRRPDPNDPTQTIWQELTLEDQLVEQLLTRTLDPKLEQFLITMYAGRPTQQVEIDHSGTVTLEQIIAGRIPNDPEGES